MRTRGTYCNPLSSLRKRRLAATLSRCGCTKIQHDALLIHRTPQIVRLTIDFHKDLIQVLLVARPGPSPAQLIGKGLPKLLAPLLDRFVGDEDSTDQHQLLDVAIAE